MLSFLIGFFGIAFIHAGWTMETDSMLDLVLQAVGLCMVLHAVRDLLYGLARFLESIDRSN